MPNNFKTDLNYLRTIGLKKLGGLKEMRKPSQTDFKSYEPLLN